MVTIVTRASKGEALTHDEVDANFNNLNSHTNSTSNPHNTTKAQVGLGSVDNTSDAAKPVSTAQQAALDLKANLAGATFTGPVVVPDKVAGTNDGSAANTKFVQTAIASLVNSSPAALDTLNELATALGNDPNFATTMTNALSLKANAANSVLTGTASVENITFSGTGRRILGDFSNATQLSRTWFQTSALNAASIVGVLPNGTSTTAGFAAFSSADPTNCGLVRIRHDGTLASLASSSSGTGGLSPLAFFISTTEAARFDLSGNFLIGTSGTAAGILHARKDQVGATYLAVENQDATAGNAAGLLLRTPNGDWIHKALRSGGYSLTAPSGTSVFSIDNSGNTSITTGNLTFSGTGQRITGDFSNATQSSRVLFQTSTTNGVTNIGALPNGTATVSSFTAFSSSDNTNNAYAQLRIDGTTAQLRSGQNGTGVVLPLVAQVGGVEVMRWDTTYNVTLAFGGGNRIAISTDQSIASTKTDLSSYTPLYLDGSKVSIRTGTGSVSEKAQVDASGNFGLGTTPASTWGAGFPMIQMQKTMLYGDVNSAYLMTNAISTSTGLKYNAAQKALRYYQDSANGIHSFAVAATGTAGGALAFTEVVQIDSSGNFRAGDQSVSNHIFRKDVSGTAFSVWNGAGTTPEGMNIYLGGLSNVATGKFLRCNDSTGDRLYILSNGNVQNTNNSYGALSDIKLKENIVDATPKLDKLMQVRIVNYNLKTDPDHKQLGVIAQEVEQVFPGIVEETPDFEEVVRTREIEVPAVLDDEGNEVEPATTKTEEYTERVATGEVTKSVKYSVFVPMLIKAMQEQQEIIRKLTHRIEQLEK